VLDQGEGGGMAGQKPWEPRDVVVVLPVVASTMAISWQVGRMLPFGGFRFFSLTEHLIAATAALPVALITTLWLGVIFGALQKAGYGIKPPRRPVMLFSILLLVTISVTAMLIYLFGVVLGSAIIFDVVILLFVANLFWFNISLTSITAMLFAFAVALIFTITLAYEQSDKLIQSFKSNTTLLSTVILKTGDKILAYVVMSGERGLLLYNPSSNLVTYLPTDDVKKVEWPR
jgi:hypothetical protein